MKLKKIFPYTNIYSYTDRFIQKIKCLVKIHMTELVFSGFTVPYITAFGAGCAAHIYNTQSIYPAYQDALFKEKQVFNSTHIYLFLVQYKVSFNLMPTKRMLVTILNNISMWK